MTKKIIILLIIILISGCSSQTVKKNNNSKYEYNPNPNLKQNQYSNYRHNSKSIKEKLNNAYDYWYGTPYKYGGTNRNGTDCSALVQNIFKKEFNINLPRTTRTQIKKGKKISKNNLKKGDLVFFRIGKNTLHVGIYKGSNQFINASSSKGVVISKLDNVYWKRHYLTSRRILPN